jgi:hypothetical protein
LRGPFREVTEVDLLGRPLEDPVAVVDGTFATELGAWEIRTFRLR